MADNCLEYTILIVDDEENILRSLRRQLVDLEYTVLTVSSGYQALELLDSREIAVIISDQRMPEMTGTEFLSLAKEKKPDTVRILLTAFCDMKDTVDAINKGEIFRYINKPWEEDELKRTVCEAVDRYVHNRETKRVVEELKRWSMQLEPWLCEKPDIGKSDASLPLVHERLQEDFESCLETFAGLIELSERRHRNHAMNVLELSRRIAEAMGVGAKELVDIRLAALLHDIGKSGIPDTILAKDDAHLTPDERLQYEQHPVRGQAAVYKVEILRDAGVLIRHHHEWVNGKGYPDGLLGDAIPIGARIIAVADALDRHAGNLSCGMRCGFVAALGSLEQDRGVKYDSAILRAAAPVAADLDEHVYGITDSEEEQVQPDDLQPGMRVSRDIRSGTDILIVPAGAELNHDNIISIQRLYALDPSAQSVFVCKTKL